MRNTLTSRHQRNNRTVNEVEVNTMSNSMAMLLIYHGLPAGLKNLIQRQTRAL
ncbi:hypothetical protein J4727_14265 [Providencia rettgeri]|uniref:Uncharacterized protein n=1 Tax=Providencia rettgeri TaxID=587 RepID=A0A939SLR3_PRORE|nr:hypothetical protein [Providencia rettgeri]